MGPGVTSLPSDKLVRAVCERLQGALRENLRSCVLYGSAVRGNLIPRRSDINLLIVLEHSTPEAHRVLAECLRPTPHISPFVIAWGELAGSQRVFALKFRSMQRHYRVLHGVDPLADFAAPPELLRFLCEQSLRNLRLRLQHAYITRPRDPQRYTHRLRRAVPALFTILSELLRCAGTDVPTAYDERTEPIGRTLRADTAVLRELLRLRKQPRTLSADEAFAIHGQLVRVLGQAADWVDERWPLPAPKDPT